MYNYKNNWSDMTHWWAGNHNANIEGVHYQQKGFAVDARAECISAQKKLGSRMAGADFYHRKEWTNHKYGHILFGQIMAS